LAFYSLSDDVSSSSNLNGTAMQERVKGAVLQAQVWIDEAGGELPPGNSSEAGIWAPSQQPPDTVEDAEEDVGTVDGRVKISPFTQATVRFLRSSSLQLIFVFSCSQTWCFVCWQVWAVLGLQGAQGMDD
jgi:hypothetical protein